jgi:enoyl-CoA hydratase/carnithine racemase
VLGVERDAARITVRRSTGRFGPMEFDTIEVSVDGPRGELALALPAKLNPLSSHTLHEIESAARLFDGHDDLKVVVVSGRGRAFSAGADVSAFGDGAGGRRPRDDADSGWRMARAMDEMRAVTVAKLHGWCVGGGLVLAAVCDLRVAARSTRFAIPEVELGIPLAWGGIPRLVRELGPALTKELVMTCREFGPEEARQAGFLNRVVDDDELDVAVDELVATLVRMPRLALLSTKAHANAVSEAMASTGRSWADADGLLAGLRDQEGRESARRYLERVRSNRR